MTPTTLQQVQVVAQIISSLAITGSLIFAAAQFRQWRRAAHVGNFTRLVELQMQLRKLRVDDPSLARVHKGDLIGLGSDQEIREYFLNLMQLSVFEIVWFSHRHGQLPADYYQSWVNRMRAIEQEESFQKMINAPGMKIFHDEFQKYVVEMARAVKPNLVTAKA